HEPVFAGEQREHVERRVIQILREGQSSPFEHEGTVRHGLRSSLCLTGVGWNTADREAANIVGAALSAIGAKRPSFEEGQRQYSTPLENCQWCGLELEKTHHAGRRVAPYCDEICAGLALRNRDFSERVKSNLAYAAAVSVAARARVPKRDCEQCGKSFRP